MSSIPIATPLVLAATAADWEAAAHAYPEGALYDPLVLSTAVTQITLARCERDVLERDGVLLHLGRPDGCPRCVENVEAPWHVSRREDGSLRCFYRCTDCTWRWHTDYSAEAIG